MNEQENENDDVVIESDSSAGNGDEMDLAEEEARADGKVAKIKKELEQCRAEKQEYLDGWQRAKADYANLVKRGSEETARAKQEGVSKAVQELFPVFDALERAKEHGELPKGFDAIATQLEAAFKKLGLEGVEAEIGQYFDPVLHEAYGQDPTDDVEKDGTISAVLEAGWRAGGVVIRPAKVRVAHHG